MRLNLVAEFSPWILKEFAIEPFCESCLTSIDRVLCLYSSAVFTSLCSSFLLRTWFLWSFSMISFSSDSRRFITLSNLSLRSLRSSSLFVILVFKSCYSKIVIFNLISCFSQHLLKLFYPVVMLENDNANIPLVFVVHFLLQFWNCFL